MAFTVFYTVQISDVATKIFEAAGGKAVVTNHFFDEAGYVEELSREQALTISISRQRRREASAWFMHPARMHSLLQSRLLS